MTKPRPAPTPTIEELGRVSLSTLQRPARHATRKSEEGEVKGPDKIQTP